jgi:hypothetical protein
MLVRWPPPLQAWPYTGFHSKVLLEIRHGHVAAAAPQAVIVPSLPPSEHRFPWDRGLDRWHLVAARRFALPYAETPADACAMYHSYIEAIPRSSGIWAYHPRAWMRETSSNLRGVPSGRERSKTVFPP